MDSQSAGAVKLGWLWFDNDPTTSLEAKVRSGAEHYRRKFGSLPRLCYVNQGSLAEPDAHCGHLKVKGASNVLPGHFLFVIEEGADRVAAV